MKLPLPRKSNSTSLNPTAPPPDNFANQRIKFRLARGRKTLIDVTQSRSRQAHPTSALSRFSSSPQVEQRPQPRSSLSVDVASLYNRSLDTWKLLYTFESFLLCSYSSILSSISKKEATQFPKNGRPHTSRSSRCRQPRPHEAKELGRPRSRCHGRLLRCVRRRCWSARPVHFSSAR